MSVIKWYIGAPRKLSFIIGALATGYLVYLDYLAPSDIVGDTVKSLAATIDDMSTGACHVTFIPAEAGTHRFWPRITDAGGVVKNIGESRQRVIDKPGY